MCVCPFAKAFMIENVSVYFTVNQIRLSVYSYVYAMLWVISNNRLSSETQEKFAPESPCVQQQSSIQERHLFHLTDRTAAQIAYKSFGSTNIFDNHNYTWIWRTQSASCVKRDVSNHFGNSYLLQWWMF